MEIDDLFRDARSRQVQRNQDRMARQIQRDQKRVAREVERERDRERVAREVRRDQERISRETERQQNRIARETRQEQKRIAREIRRERERVAREVERDRERVAREAERKQNRIARETREEQERITREIRQERERVNREIGHERERLARKMGQKRERVARETRLDRDSLRSRASSLSSRPIKRHVGPNFIQPRDQCFPVFSPDEFDQFNSDRRSYSSDTLHSISSTSSDCCPYLLLARDLGSSLNWPPVIFNRQLDRCFCSSCYKSDWSDVSDAAGAPYVIPRGWVRLGVFVDPVVEQVHNIWNRWQVTYHGTSIEAALSILKQRQFGIPGDQLLNGNFLSIRPGHIPGKQYIYTSPTIAYSSLPGYCSSYRFTSRKNQRYRVKVVLQCRQDPQLMQIQGETVGIGRRRICPYISNRKIEYFTEARASLITYGLLLKFEKLHQ